MLQGIYNAQQSMVINQTALNIINTNISNMNTPGYSKQRIELSENPYVGSVQIDKISRYSDLYLSNYYRNENTTLSYYNEAAVLASYIQDMANELSNSSITTALQDFYSKVQTLSTNPTSAVARSEFVETAIALCAQLNQSSQQLSDLRTSLVGDPNIVGSVNSSKLAISCEELNTKLKMLADINKTIAVSISSDSTVKNSIFDQRDMLLDEISSYIPVNIEENPNGTVNVSLGNIFLIKGTEQKLSFNVVANSSANPDEVYKTPSLVQLVDKDGNTVVQNANNLINSGSIGAIIDVGGADSTKLTIFSVLESLDTFAAAFAETVNAIQLYVDDPVNPTKAALCLDSSTNPATLKVATEPIFVNTSGGTTGIKASNIKINQAIVDNPDEIATARGSITAGVPDNINATDDKSNILEMAQVRNKKLSGLNNLTTEEYLANFTGNLGVKITSIDNKKETQESIVQQISITLESQRGVNLDEELIDLVKFQRAYEASARIFNVCNEILETLVKLGT